MREAVTDVVRKQIEAGIDIVTDGEQGKASFFGYIVERFSGFERKPAAPGKERQTAGGGQGVPRFSRLLRVVRAYRRTVWRTKRRARARRRRYLHRAGQL